MSKYKVAMYTAEGGRRKRKKKEKEKYVNRCVRCRTTKKTKKL